MGAPATSRAQQSLFTDMDRAKDLVDTKTAEIDAQVLKPASDAFRKASSAYPLATLFMTVFAALSIFPVIAFVGFSICAGSLILATSLVFLFAWLGVIIGSAAIVLAGTLAITFSLSVMATGTVASGVVLYRLVFHIRQTASVKAGTQACYAEIKKYLTAERSVASQPGENIKTYFPTLDGSMKESKLSNGHHDTMDYVKAEA